MQCEIFATGMDGQRNIFAWRFGINGDRSFGGFGGAGVLGGFTNDPISYTNIPGAGFVAVLTGTDQTLYMGVKLV